MEIVRIERKRTRAARYVVHFDDAPPMTVAEDILVRFRLSRGDRLSGRERAEIERAEEVYSARRSAVNYISYRPRSEQEVRRHLSRKGFSEEVAAASARELREAGVIDDTAFAQAFVRDALARGRSGPRLLRKKLAEKGVARTIAEVVLTEYVSADAEEEQAVDLLRRRVDRSQRTLMRLEPRQRRARLYSYLVQRGFSGAAAQNALHKVKV